MDFDARHFHLLRMALARRLKAERLSAGVYGVTSHSVPGRVYKVPVGGPCPCPSVKECTHLALALDRFMLEEAATLEAFEYESAKREDWKELRLRILRRQTTPLDEEYLKFAAERAAIHLEPVAA
jgi:hypothetical protein